MDNVKLAYLAGLFDGEGTIGIARYRRKDRTITKDYYFLRLKVCNKNKDAMRLFKNTFHAGCLCRDKRSGVWDWSVSGTQHGKRVIELLLPFLRIKRKQAKLALEFTVLNTNNDKERSKVEMSALNHGK